MRIPLLLLLGFLAIVGCALFDMGEEDSPQVPVPQAALNPSDHPPISRTPG